MSIASDIRTYADSAVAQGKQSLASAQAQLGGVAGTANDYASSFADKAGDTVNDLRATAEKTINLDAIRTAVEPYLTQVKEYGASVTDRAELVLTNLRSDKRVARVLDSATAVTDVVVEQVNDRIVKPVQSVTGIGVKQAAPARKPAPKPAAKQAGTRPAARKTASPTTARKTTARKTSSTSAATTTAKRTPKA
ncbi:hypothetical protein [uncultured Jatrophihabitans sp.]|uniref:hypothetical protein n=1 Tax=uncultured Jatrophihabitans sp. TaxID=1610747 RepID=UPI0035CA1044